MNSTLKGDRLEENFYQFLLDQQERGELVFDAYPAENCKIHRQKKYFCKERDADIEFDIVIEFFRKGSSTPHSYAVFECKNYDGNIPETCVTDFSSKLNRIFRHAAKGVLVISSRLQSGAENVARHSKMGIVKFDERGLEIIADRRGGSLIENSFVRKQIYKHRAYDKSLKFSALYEGHYYANVHAFLNSLQLEENSNASVLEVRALNVPYLSSDAIKDYANNLLNRVAYKDGPVDLKNICSALSINLQFTNIHVQDSEGTEILGTANFDRRTILINTHGNVTRERFTLGHEIGHFFLNHQLYLASESVVENDLRITSENNKIFNYQRLEYQANTFSSNLILPDEIFKRKTAEFRHILGITDRGHGYIFVDDQPHNYQAYEKLLIQLLTYFEVSKQAIQFKLRKLGMLTDQRTRRVSQLPGIGKLLATYQRFEN